MRRALQWNIRYALLAGAVLVFASGCAEDSAAPRQAAVRERAESLLAELRAGRWAEAAEFVSFDGVTRERLELAAGASPEATRSKMALWFEALYGNVPPGHVYAVKFDPQDSALAIVTYRAGDLDAFNMRLVDGEWYYTLDWRPRSE